MLSIATTKEVPAGRLHAVQSLYVTGGALSNVCMHACMSVYFVAALQHDVLRTSVQGPSSHLLHYHHSTPCAANTKVILDNADMRAPYDCPYPAVNGSIGRVVATNLDPRPGSMRLKTIAEAKRFQSMPDSMVLVVRGLPTLAACSTPPAIVLLLD